MTDHSSNWQCCFCEWEINSSSFRSWMKSARASKYHNRSVLYMPTKISETVYLLDGQAHLSDAKFSEARCNYIDDKWLERPDSQVAHLVHSCCWEFFTYHCSYDHIDLNRLFQAISSKLPVYTRRASQSVDQRE